MKLINLKTSLKALKTFNDELRHADCFKEKNFTSGLIAFRPTKKSDPRQINHDDQDVICHIVKGTGRLRIRGKRTALRPGMICHIPKGTPHDFAAGKKGELVLFYVLVTTV